MSMDHSANSGSVQSSSGDVDFDSRAADSFSALFNLSSAAAAAGNSLPLPLPSCNYHLFDPISYLDRSSPFPTLPSSAAAGASNSWASLRPLHVPSYTTDFPILTTPSPAITSVRPFAAADLPPMPVQQAEPPPAAAATAQRSSKKRSRASRRAPTTVLTTDTSNFRAMVQEFTGIPSSPFAAVSGSSPAIFPGFSRFDFLNSSVAAADSPILPTPYLLRPFAHKARDFTSSKAINLISSPNANSPILNPSPNSINPTNDISSSDILGLGNQCKSLPNIQTPFLDFQFGLPTIANAPFNTILGRPMGIMAGSSDQILHSNWSSSANYVSESNKIYQAQFAGEYATSIHQQAGGCNCKQNFSPSDLSPEINPGKGQEAVPPPRGGEGMLESWICSSDN